MSESPTVKAMTRPSSVSERATGNGSVGSRETSTDVIPRASRRPAVPPSTNSNTVSVSSCRMSRARPAPIARRSAISCRRAAARARRTPATFAHAMINTNDTITVSNATNATIGPPLPGTGEEASSRNPVRRFCSWCSCSSVWPITSISAAAWAIETPGFNRPPIRNPRAARSVSVACERSRPPPCPSAPTRPTRGRPCRGIPQTRRPPP